MNCPYRMLMVAFCNRPFRGNDAGKKKKMDSRQHIAGMTERGSAGMKERKGADDEALGKRG